MSYLSFIILIFIVMMIMGVILKSMEDFGVGANVCSIMAAIYFLVVLIGFSLFIKGPSEKNYSKKEVLESQKIEVILDSNTEPVEDGQYREAMSKDCDVYEGVITYTSDKKLDKTYQKIRYYGSFFYDDFTVIYLYDPEKALTNDK